MDRLIAHAQSDNPAPNLALALSFDSSEKGEKKSFRKVLKKYTRSTVFSDLRISLILVRENEDAEMILPDHVNPFLEDLNLYITNKIVDKKQGGLPA